MTFCQLEPAYCPVEKQEVYLMEVICEDKQLFFRQKTPSKTKVKVFDPLGRLIAQGMILGQFDSISLDFPLPQGIYTVMMVRDHEATFFDYFVILN